MVPDFRLPITIGFVVWVTLVTILRRRLAPGAEGRGVFVFIGGAMATGVLWLSPFWAAALASAGFLLIFGLGTGVVGGLVAGGVTFGLSVAVPGGASTVLAGVVTLGLLSVAWTVRRRLQMQVRSERLLPGDRTDEPVLLEARVPPRATVQHPVSGSPVVAWRVVSGGDVHACEPARLALQSDAGTVVLDLAACELDGPPAEDHPVASLSPEVRALCPSDLDDEATLTVELLPPDTVLTVAGHPSWVAAPPGEAYRGSFDVPLFERHEDEAPFVAARSLETQRRVDRADLVELGGWMVACVGAAAAQLLTAS